MAIEIEVVKAETAEIAEKVEIEDVTEAPPEEAPEPKPAAQKGPTPKPGKSSATRVGIIALAAHGLIKKQQEDRNRSGGQTFTDRRDREQSRRRDMKAKARERLRDRRKGNVHKKGRSTVVRKGEVVLEAPVTLKSFSAATGISVNRVMHSLISLDMMVSINTILDVDTIELVADEFGIEVRIKEKTDIEKGLMEDIMAARHAVDEDSMAPRPPVLAIMGHVDHG